MKRGMLRRYFIATIILLLSLASVIQPASAAPNPAICTSVTQIPLAECQALVALYNSTGGANWSNHTNWLETTTPSNWYGVTVSGGHVTNLTLAYDNLIGPLPAEIGSLPTLQVLFLNGNQLNGSIPDSIGGLTGLRSLSLGVNLLTGPIPDSIGSLTNLQNFSLNGNQLSGSIPPQMGSMASLQNIFMNGNNLDGAIPPQLGNLNSLKILNLGSNRLSGSIPAQLGNLPNLQALFLDNNQLTGSIPAGLGVLGAASNLTQISFANNQLSGQIPPELGSLAKLTYLNLRSNQLNGAIPPQLGSLSALVQLLLGSNQLSGSIPPEIGGLLLLENLALNSNQLTGDIPPEIGGLVSLQNLFLQFNQLSGAIPTSIGSLTALRILFLNNNSLSGDVPVTLVNLINIADADSSGSRLRLDYNELTVPAGYPSGSALDNYLELKNPGWNTTQGIAVSIPASGDLTLVSRDNLITITVPQGAAAGATSLKLTLLSAPTHDPSPLAFAHHAFILTALNSNGNEIPNFTFNPAVTVAMQYADTDLTNISDESGMRLYHWGSAWEDSTQTCTPAGAFNQNLAANTLSLGMCATGQFALLGPARLVISGQATDGIHGISGVTISAENNSTHAMTTTTTDTDGNYSFDTLDQGNYTLTAAKAGFSFAPVSQPVDLTSTDQSGVNFTGTPLRLGISGQITDGVNPIEGVTVAIGNLVSTLTDADGNYDFAGLPTGAYTLTPSKLSYTFEPASRQVTLLDNDAAGVNFTGTLHLYAISGQISDGVNGMAGVTVSAGSASTTTDANGNYTLSGLLVGAYTVTPSLAGYFFTPATRQVTLTNADQNGVNFTGALIRYAISGQITHGGSGIAGVTVSNGSVSAVTDAGGHYTLSNLLPGSYTLTPSKANYTFDPVSRLVTLTNADQTAIDFTGVPDTYFVYLPSIVR